jgi:hypothetical protein
MIRGLSWKTFLDDSQINPVLQLVFLVGDKHEILSQGFLGGAFN